MCVLLKVKFRVCTPPRNWSLSFPPLKIWPRRMDSPSHSTTTFPTVSAVYLLTTHSLLLIFFFFYLFPSMWYSSFHCKTILRVIPIQGLFLQQCPPLCLYLMAFFCPTAVQCCVECRNCAVSLRLRLLQDNEINSSIIVKVNPLKSSLLSLTIQFCQGGAS